MGDGGGAGSACGNLLANKECGLGGKGLLSLYFAGEQSTLTRSFTIKPLPWTTLSVM
jgi:hypothetical protein